MMPSVDPDSLRKVQEQQRHTPDTARAVRLQSFSVKTWQQTTHFATNLVAAVDDLRGGGGGIFACKQHTRPWAIAAAMALVWRYRPSMSASAVSATSSVPYAGTFTTGMPHWPAATWSTLSKPTPMRTMAWKDQQLDQWTSPNPALGKMLQLLHADVQRVPHANVIGRGDNVAHRRQLLDTLQA